MERTERFKDVDACDPARALIDFKSANDLRKLQCLIFNHTSTRLSSLRLLLANSSSRLLSIYNCFLSTPPSLPLSNALPLPLFLFLSLKSQLHSAFEASFISTSTPLLQESPLPNISHSTYS
ncbi:hypothetical protein ACTXT7_009441 [Hymenolepis weldensis]